MNQLPKIFYYTNQLAYDEKDCGLFRIFLRVCCYFAKGQRKTGKAHKAFSGWQLSYKDAFCVRCRWQMQAGIATLDTMEEK